MKSYIMLLSALSALVIVFLLLIDVHKYEETKVIEVIEEEEVVEEVTYNAFNNDYQPEEWEVDLLCKLISCEVGDRYSGECVTPEWVVQYTISVVINRVNNSAFEDTIFSVIYEPKQYQPAIDGTILDAKYDDTIRENVEYCLVNGSVIPADVVYQSEYENNGSGTYAKWTSNVTGATIYFNYI